MTNEPTPPHELPELHDLPKLPGRVTLAYALGVVGAVVAAAGCFLAAAMSDEPWAIVAGMTFAALALSQAMSYLWRAEAWEAHVMAVALSRAVAWLSSEGHPEPW